MDLWKLNNAIIGLGSDCLSRALAAFPLKDRHIVLAQVCRMRHANDSGTSRSSSCGEDLTLVAQGSSSRKGGRSDSQPQLSDDYAQPDGNLACEPAPREPSNQDFNITIDATFVANVAMIRQHGTAIQFFEKKVAELTSKLESINYKIGYMNWRHNEPSPSDIFTGAGVAISNLKNQAERISDALEAVESALAFHKSSLNALLEENQLTVEISLLDSQLLSADDLVFKDDRAIPDDCSSVMSMGSLERIPSPSEINILENAGSEVTFERDVISDEQREAMMLLEQKKVELLEKEEAFDKRDLLCQEALQGYLARVDNGEEGPSRTEFDLYMLGYGQDVTRELIAAEGAYGEAFHHARDLGILGNGSDISSNFVDDVDDGYLMSGELARLATKDWSRIDRWLEATPDANESEQVILEGEADEWDASSIDFGESLSVCNFGRQRKRIQRWDQIRSDRWRLMLDEDPSAFMDLADESQLDSWGLGGLCT